MGLVTETFPLAGGHREVSAFVPEGPVEALVLCGDGDVLVPWGVDLVRTMVVGVHRAVDEQQRLGECVPTIEPERFAAHEELLLGDVRAWVADRFGVALPRERTATLGVSASGELALALGLRHPDVIGVVLCASPGAGFRPPATFAGPLPRAYLLAGSQEPFFRDNALRWARALAAAGGEVEMVEREGGHGGPFWRQELPAMVEWAFGHGRTS